MTASGCCRARGAGLERHQTLRHAVQWSYDLLDDDERMVLRPLRGVRRRLRPRRRHRSRSATGFDEYAVLDVLDSLVRKSLVTVDRRQVATPATGCWRRSASSPRSGSPRAGRSTRSASDTPATSPSKRSGIGTSGTGPTSESLWTGSTPSSPTCAPGSAGPLIEATSPTATAIAAHDGPAGLGRCNGSSPSFGSKRSSRPPRRPKSLNSRGSTPPPASACSLDVPRPPASMPTGRSCWKEDPRFDPIEPGLSSMFEAGAHRYAGRLDRSFEIYTSLSTPTRAPSPRGSVWHDLGAPSSRNGPSRRYELPRKPSPLRARMATPSGSPMRSSDVGSSLRRAATRLAPSRLVPPRTLLRQRSPSPLLGRRASREAAALEAVHGDLERALTLFDTTIDSFHRAGDHANVGGTLAEPCRLLRPHRTTRERRHAVRSQHPLRPRQPREEHARRGRQPESRARRDSLRHMCR